MPAFALRDIERTMRSLWMDRTFREGFLDAREDAGCSKNPSTKPRASTTFGGIERALLDQIDVRGVKLYSGLLRYGYHDVIDSVYPCCARLLGDRWDDIVDHYIHKFPPDHYNLNRTAARMARYFEQHGRRWLKRHPYLVELADYEWLELELMEQETPINQLPHQALTLPQHFELYAPVVNPVLRIRRYSYPITSIVEHLQGDCCLPRHIEPQPTCVAVFRDPDTNKCRFLEIGDVTAQIIESSLEKPQSYGTLLVAAMNASGGSDPQRSVMDFLELVEKLQDLKLFVGSVTVTQES